MVRCYIRRVFNVILSGFFAFIVIGTLLSMENLFQFGSLRGQLLVDYIGNNLMVEYVRSESSRTMLIKLTNNGSEKIPGGNWALFFTHVGGFPDLEVKKSKAITESGILIRRLHGGLYSLEPILTGKRRTLFAGLKPHRSLVVRQQAHLRSKWYLFPNWYVAGRGLEPRIIQSTYMKRPHVDYSFFDKWPPEERFVRNNVRNLNQSVKAVIPTPLSVEIAQGEVKLNKSWSVVYDNDFLNEALFLAEELHMKLIKSISLSRTLKRIVRLSRKNLSSCLTNITSSNITQFNDSKRLFPEEDYTFNASKRLYLEEGYAINIKNDTIDICGETTHGIYYGIQSLLSLLENSQDGNTLPLLQMVDAPRFEFRGLLYDVARHFIDKYEILKTIKLMATYKLNRLHLHLTDDEGWRIEIPALPELTKVGSRRGHDLQEERCLFPFYGTEPIGNSPKRQYYSVQDYRDILLYAESHHVQVIPEIDMPGHAHAAVQSMRIRYMNMKRKNVNEKIAGSYLLHDLDDTLRNLGVPHQTDAVMNPCIESTYTFIKEVIRTMITLHQDTQPLKRLHLGGDEVNSVALTSSPACFALGKIMPELGGNFRNYFIKRIMSICEELGVRIQMWEEGFAFIKDRDVSNKADFVVNAWMPTVSAYHRANQGYKVILTHAHKFYLDHPYEPDGDELGLFWATRNTDARSVFDFMFNGEFGSHRNANFSKEKNCRALNFTNCLELKSPENIIGMQASLWGELIQSNEDFEYMLCPRLLAFAERAWHKADWEAASTEMELSELRDADWTDFANTLGYKELPFLERMGIKYRLPVPGFRIRDNIVEANTEFPGSLLQFSTDGGNTWNTYNEENPPEKSENLSFSVVSHDLLRRSRIISV